MKSYAVLVLVTLSIIGASHLLADDEAVNLMEQSAPGVGSHDGFQQIETYVVEESDVLEHIGRRLRDNGLELPDDGFERNRLAVLLGRLNGIEDIHTILPGNTIYIPPVPQTSNRETIEAWLSNAHDPRAMALLRAGFPTKEELSQEEECLLEVIEAMNSNIFDTLENLSVEATPESVTMLARKLVRLQQYSARYVELHREDDHLTHRLNLLGDWALTLAGALERFHTDATSEYSNSLDFIIQCGKELSASAQEAIDDEQADIFGINI